MLLSEIYKYAELAYDEPESLPLTEQFVCGNDELDFFFIAELQDVIIVSFRGTDSEDGITRGVIKRWIRNFDKEPLVDDGAWGKGTIHRGAYMAWIGLKSRFLSVLMRVLEGTVNKPILITGHSLGAWIAVLATRHLYKNAKLNLHYDIGCVYFGMPNLFTLAGVREYNSLAKTQTIGCMNGYDIVDEYPHDMFKPRVNFRLYQPAWHDFLFCRIGDHLPKCYRKALVKKDARIVL